MSLRNAVMFTGRYEKEMRRRKLEIQKIRKKVRKGNEKKEDRDTENTKKSTKGE